MNNEPGAAPVASPPVEPPPASRNFSAKRLLSIPRRWAVLLVILLVVIAAAIAWPLWRSHHQPGRNLRISSTKDIGVVGQPASVIVRDGGVSGGLGQQTLWLFGDTLFSPAGVDGASGRSNTAGWANISDPTKPSEPVDPNGAPYQLIPLTRDEQAYNAAHHSGSDRYAIWPSSAVPLNSSTLLIYYLKIKVSPGYLNYGFDGIGVATIGPGQSSATRLPGLLFTSGAQFGRTAVIHNGYLYAYACNNSSTSCSVARVNPADYATAHDYQAWDGSGWSSDLSHSQAVIKNISGLSVAWDGYLQRYVVAYMLYGSNSVTFQTAAQPQGPWSGPITGFKGLTPSGNVDYSVQLHPELSTDNGQTMYVSYFRPVSGGRGELHLVKVTLK